MSAASAAEAPRRRSALIFLSGLGERRVDQSAAGVARRLAAEMDRQAATGSARFAVQTGTHEAQVGETLTVGRATILRTGHEGDVAAVDVWRMETEKTLTQRHEDLSLWRKVLHGLIFFLRYSWKALAIMRPAGASKTPKERRQLLVARVCMLLLAVYFVALVFVLAASFANADWMPKQVSGALLFVTGLGIWKGEAVRQLANGAVQAHCVLQYIDDGARADVLRGRLSQLLEHLHQQDDVTYQRIDVVAYSFGTLVAIDAFFPLSEEPGPRYESVTTLVTIGCPFDLIRTYWPHYYEQRHRRPGAPGRWLNVYSPLDVLGSNFRDNAGKKTGVKLRDGTLVRPESGRWVVGGRDADEPSTLEILLMVGLRVHAMYWGPTFEQEATAFSPVVRELYAGEALLD